MGVTVRVAWHGAPSVKIADEAIAAGWKQCRESQACCAGTFCDTVLPSLCGGLQQAAVAATHERPTPSDEAANLGAQIAVVMPALGAGGEAEQHFGPAALR